MSAVVASGMLNRSKYLSPKLPPKEEDNYIGCLNLFAAFFLFVLGFIAGSMVTMIGEDAAQCNRVCPPPLEYEFGADDTCICIKKEIVIP